MPRFWLHATQKQAFNRKRTPPFNLAINDSKANLLKLLKLINWIMDTPIQLQIDGINVDCRLCVEAVRRNCLALQLKRAVQMAQTSKRGASYSSFIF